VKPKAQPRLLDIGKAEVLRHGTRVVIFALGALVPMALEAAERMAKLTGNDADIAGFETMRKEIADNYNRVFWKGDEYRSPGYTGRTDERGHALAVVFGLAKPAQWPAIKAVMAREFHASPYLEKYVMESLFQMNDPEAALARMKNRYRKMVDSDLSTLWEGWGIGGKGFGGGSYNHGWCGGPLTLMTEYVAGIAPTSPAFATYRVRPQMGSLRNVHATVPTLKGLIDLQILNAPGQFKLTLTSPAGTRATVAIPCSAGASDKDVLVNGQPFSPSTGIKFLQRNGGFLDFEVTPGRWEFAIKREFTSGERK